MTRFQWGVVLLIATAVILSAGVAGAQADDWPDDEYVEVSTGNHFSNITLSSDSDRFKISVTKTK